MWEHNKKKLLQLITDTPIAKVQAVNQGLHAKASTTTTSGGLPGLMYLCRNAKVTLTVSLSVHHGLFNRDPGKIVDVIYLNGKRPKTDLPDVVMIDFDTYTGPSFIDTKPKIVPIVPVERNLQAQDNTSPFRMGNFCT